MTEEIRVPAGLIVASNVPYVPDTDAEYAEGRVGRYKVRVLETNDGYFVKPYPGVNDDACAGHCSSEQSFGYHSFEYERMFRFGSHCEGFNSEALGFIAKS